MKLSGYKPITVYVPEKFGSYNAKITIEKDKEVIEWLDESTLSKGEGKEDSFLSVLEENYEAAKNMAEEDRMRSLYEMVIETYEDLISIYKAKYK